MPNYLIVKDYFYSPLDYAFIHPCVVQKTKNGNNVVDFELEKGVVILTMLYQNSKF